MLLYWAFMERAVHERLTLFNFGRCTPGAGTHRFKRQWGSRDEQLWWYQQARAGASATPRRTMRRTHGDRGSGAGCLSPSPRRSDLA